MGTLGYKRPAEDAMQCSFCRKTQASVGKLISSPGDYPRSYICDECIAVCSSILDDDKREAEPAQLRADGGRFAQHPLVFDFLFVAERWALNDLSGTSASEELHEMRALAARMLNEN